MSSDIFDIFISYRRKGGFSTAGRINDLLVREGYTVSYDIDTLREGRFDKQLFERIEQCMDFILIVDENCFERTLDPKTDPQDDWLRQELAYALQLKKNVIPVLLAGASFPKGLPEEIADVRYCQGPSHTNEYFDSFFKKLKGYLHALPRNSIGQQNDSNGHFSSPAKALPKLKVKTDLDCIFLIDGEEKAQIKAGCIYKTPLLVGQYILKFVSSENNADFIEIDFDMPNAEIVQKVDLRTIRNNRLQKEAEEKRIEEEACKRAEKEERTKAEEARRKAEEARKKTEIEKRQKEEAEKQYLLKANECFRLGKYEDAYRYYKMINTITDAEAQYNIAWMFHTGKGATQNNEVAICWYRESAEQGLSIAQNALGWMYQNGRGCKKNYEESVKWYRKAAEQGYKHAQHNLGLMYQLGKGVLQSDEEALKWYSKAAEQGKSDAKKKLEEIKRKKAEEAKRLAEENARKRAKAEKQQKEDAQKQALEKSIEKATEKEPVIGATIRLLQEGKPVILPVKGPGMRPFIREIGESILLVKIDFIQKGDIVLALGNEGNVRISRVIRVEDESVTLRGDANKALEYYAVPFVLGKVKEVYRNGDKKIDSVNSIKWRLYSWLWLRCPFSIRIFCINLCEWYEEISCFKKWILALLICLLVVIWYIQSLLYH